MHLHHKISNVSFFFYKINVLNILNIQVTNVEENAKILLNMKPNHQ